MVPESLGAYLAWLNYKSLFSSYLAVGESLCLLFLSGTGGIMDLNSPNSQGWLLGSIHSLTRLGVYSAESD